MSKKVTRLVGYVIREGLERGKGRYLGLGHRPGANWKDTRSHAVTWDERPLDPRLEWGSSRVVRIVRRTTPKAQHVVEVIIGGTFARVYLNSHYVEGYEKPDLARALAVRLRKALASPSPLPTDAADEAIVDALKAKRDAQCQSRPMRTDEAAIRADERERCAKECERLAKVERDAQCTGAESVYKFAAARIRGLR